MVNTTLFATKPGTKPVTKSADTFNEAGGKAYSHDNKHALAQLAATGCLNRTFYATAETQLQQVLDLVANVPTEFVAKTAIFARERGFMKDMPALLTAVIAARQDSETLAKVFPRTIDNGKMLRNFIQIIRSGVTGRKSLGTAPKRLVRRWFESRTAEDIFRQSVGNAPSLADVLKIVHPKPDSKDKEALYGWILGKEYNYEFLPGIVKQFEDFKKKNSKDIPNVPFEMLTALELDTDAWCEIAKNARWQWTRMNLNTMQRHGVFAKSGMVDLVAKKLVDCEAIEKARVFPYQLLAAYINVGVEIPAKITNALQDALEIATANVPKVKGKVYVLVDVSGSMSHPATGVRYGSTSKVTCVDVAALISSVVLRKNDEAEVIPFSDRMKEISLNPRDSVMTNATKIRAVLGGGTNCSAPLAMLNEKQAKGDLVFLISDNQSWIDTYGGSCGPTRLMDEWTKFRGRNHGAKLVVLDIQPNTHTQAYERSDILNVGGFSDHVFEIVSAFASNELDQGYWVGEIEKIRL
jgi:60 kDa SS-A/Ro ribonucleoprotein